MLCVGCSTISTEVGVRQFGWLMGAVGRRRWAAWGLQWLQKEPQP